MSLDDWRGGFPQGASMYICRQDEGLFVEKKKKEKKAIMNRHNSGFCAQTK